MRSAWHNTTLRSLISGSLMLHFTPIKSVHKTDKVMKVSVLRTLSVRKTDESVRKTDESVRKTDESVRKTDESVRKTDERGLRSRLRSRFREVKNPYYIVILQDQITKQEGESVTLINK